MCVSGLRTVPSFSPDTKHFIVNCEKHIAKYAENWGEM